MVLIKFLIRGAARVDGGAARQGTMWGRGGGSRSEYFVVDPGNLCTPEIIGKVPNSYSGVLSVTRASLDQRLSR